MNKSLAVISKIFFESNDKLNNAKNKEKKMQMINKKQTKSKQKGKKVIVQEFFFSKRLKLTGKYDIWVKTFL